LTRFDFLHDPLPTFVETLRSVRLAPRLYAPAAACLAILCVLAVWFGVEAVRMRAAQTLEQRALARFDRSHAALTGLRLESRHLDELLAQDRRLREVRLSGSVVATHVAHLGNAFPRRSWLTSMTATTSSAYGLKGYASDLPTLETILGNVLGDKTIGRPHGIRMSRDDRGRAGWLAFEVRLDGAP
jgi:hypothetical protein